MAREGMENVEMIAGKKHAPKNLGRVLILGLGKSGTAAAEYCLDALGSRVAGTGRHFYMVDISMIETLITGSVLSVLASVSVLFLAFRKKRYITVRRQQEDKRQMLAAKSGSVAVKE